MEQSRNNKRGSNDSPPAAVTTPKRQNVDRARPAHSKACSRCRKRKIKCDYVLPSCSSCKTAGTLCVGYDLALQKEVPRSIVSYLESRAATLEIEVRGLEASKSSQRAIQNENQPIANTGHSPTPLSIGEALAAAMVTVVTPSGVNDDYTRYFHSAFLLRPCSLPLPFPNQLLRSTNIDPVAPSRSVRKATHLPDVPRSAADLVLKNYVEIHLPQYPCVYEPDLLRAYELCFERPDDASPFDVFIVCMALAISANTLIWRNEENARAASAGFWANAKDQLQNPITLDSDIKKLQSALLLAHYSFTNPTAVDVWYCVGDAARLCIQLGYHKEVSSSSNLNVLELDTRRRLFWTTYGMERGICSYLRLPFSLDEDTVTTQFPSSLADHCIRPEGFLEGHQKKASALHFWQFRRLETEVHRVLYLEKDYYPFKSIEDWSEDVASRLHRWHMKAFEFTTESKIEFRDVQLKFLLGRLHRPTPRNRYPSRTSRLQSVDSALCLADEYAKQRRHGRLFYPWFAGHILYEAAVVLLDTVWLCCDWLPEAVDTQEIAKCIRYYPNILHQVATFWPALDRCADTLAVLSEPILARLEHRAGLGLPSLSDDATSNELAKHLFPESGLALVERTVETSGAGNWAHDLPNFDFEDFDWNAEPLPEGLFDIDDITLLNGYSSTTELM